MTKNKVIIYASKDGKDLYRITDSNASKIVLEHTNGDIKKVRRGNLRMNTSMSLNWNIPMKRTWQHLWRFWTMTKRTITIGSSIPQPITLKILVIKVLN